MTKEKQPNIKALVVQLHKDKKWLKRVDKVYLSKSGGYGFEGEFLDINEGIEVPLGSILICVTTDIGEREYRDDGSYVEPIWETAYIYRVVDEDDYYYDSHLTSLNVKLLDKLPYRQNMDKIKRYIKDLLKGGGK